MTQRADIMWSVGGNTQQFDRAIETSRNKANRALNSMGSNIEKRTEGMRKFAGALGSTAGIISGIVGPLGLLVGGVTAIAVGWERARNAAREAAMQVEKQRRDAEAYLRELRADRGSGNMLGVDIEKTVKPIEERIRKLRDEAHRLRGRAAMAESAGIIGNLGAAFGLGTDPNGNRSRAGQLDSKAAELEQELYQQTLARVKASRDAIRARMDEFDLAQKIAAAQRAGNAFEVQRLQARSQATKEIAELEEQVNTAYENGHNDLAKRLQSRVTIAKRGLKDQLTSIDELEAAEGRRVARAAEMAELQARVEIMRADGQGEAADALQRRLELEQRIDAINQNSLYTQERKLELINAATAAAERYEDAIRRNQRAEAMTTQQRLEVMALRSAGLSEEASQYRAMIEHQERLKDIEKLREISQEERMRLIALSEQILANELNGSGAGGGSGSVRYGASIGPQAGEYAARIGSGGQTQQQLTQKSNTLLEKIVEQVGIAIDAVRESGGKGASYS